jgi:hypothetical protein
MIFLYISAKLYNSTFQLDFKQDVADAINMKVTLNLHKYYILDFSIN